MECSFVVFCFDLDPNKCAKMQQHSGSEVLCSKHIYQCPSLCCLLKQVKSREGCLILVWIYLPMTINLILLEAYCILSENPIQPTYIQACNKTSCCRSHTDSTVGSTLLHTGQSISQASRIQTGQTDLQCRIQTAMFASYILWSSGTCSAAQNLAQSTVPHSNLDKSNI